MGTNAPGQLLGYAIQVPRALYYLLCSSPGDLICVEVISDVSHTTSTGVTTSEEDKSSISSNPLTNRSTDLWKTFFNWAVAVKTGSIDISKTEFVLFCNYPINNGFVKDFSIATSESEISNCLVKVTSELADISATHEIWRYFNFLMNENRDIFSNIIKKFTLQLGDGTGQELLRNELKRQHVSEMQIDFLIDKMYGWLQKTILELIHNRKPAIITWEDFDHEFKVAYDRARRRELIDFTLTSPPNSTEIESHKNMRPLYIQQLEAIECDDAFIQNAVTDYLKAKVNLGKWIEDEIIDIDIANDFEGKLKSFWHNAKMRIELTQSSSAESVRGKLLCIECQTRQETIRNMTPPSSTIEGTYHSMANQPLLGWHPKWNIIFGS